MIGEDWAPAGYEMWQNSAGCWQVFEDGSSWPWTDGIRHMIECIETGTAPVITPEHAYHVLEIMLKSMESGDTGQAIPIESTFTPPRFDGASTLGPGAHLVHDPGRRDMTYKPSPRPTFDGPAAIPYAADHPPSLGRRGRGRSGGLDLCLQRPHPSARVRAAAGRRFSPLRCVPHRLRRRRRLLRAERDAGDRQSGHRRGAATANPAKPRFSGATPGITPSTTAPSRCGCWSSSRRRPLRGPPAPTRGPSPTSNLRTLATPATAGWVAGRRPRPKNRPAARSTPSERATSSGSLQGRERPLLVGLLVSTEHLTVGRIDLLPGQRSEAECHGGDEAIYVLSGTVHVRPLGESGPGWLELARARRLLPSGGNAAPVLQHRRRAGIAPVRRRAVLPVRGARRWTRRGWARAKLDHRHRRRRHQDRRGRGRRLVAEQLRSGARYRPDPSEAPAAVLADIETLAETVAGELRRDGRGPVAIGIGVPELVDAGGRIRSAHLLDWSAIPLCGALGGDRPGLHRRRRARRGAGRGQARRRPRVRQLCLRQHRQRDQLDRRAGRRSPGGRTRRGARALLWLAWACPVPSAAPGPSSCSKTTPRVRRWRGATPRPPVTPSKGAEAVDRRRKCG